MFPDPWPIASRRQLAAARMLLVFARAGARSFLRGAADFFFCGRGFSGERRRRCREHFPLRRQPVLIGLTVRSAMCGPDLVGPLADTVFQTLIHVKVSCLG